MYDLFFKDSILSYIEYYSIIITIIYIFFKNRELFFRKYIYKYSTTKKSIILIATSILNIIILSLLYIYNVHWIIGIAYNSLTIALIIILTISLFFKKN